MFAKNPLVKHRPPPWYRYLAGLVALWFVDTRKKDFVEMSLHHVVTILLLVLSYTASHMRVGAVVFVLHNLADPFLQSAKLCKVRTRARESVCVCVRGASLRQLVKSQSSRSGTPAGPERSSEGAWSVCARATAVVDSASECNLGAGLAASACVAL